MRVFRKPGNQQEKELRAAGRRGPVTVAGLRVTARLRVPRALSSLSSTNLVAGTRCRNHPDAKAPRNVHAYYLDNETVGFQNKAAHAADSTANELGGGASWALLCGRSLVQDWHNGPFKRRAIVSQRLPPRPTPLWARCGKTDSTSDMNDQSVCARGSI